MMVSMIVLVKPISLQLILLGDLGGGITSKTGGSARYHQFSPPSISELGKFLGKFKPQKMVPLLLLPSPRAIPFCHPGKLQAGAYRLSKSYLCPRPGTNFDPQVVANEDLLDYCQVQDMTLLAYSPLLGGAYTQETKSIPEEYRGQDAEVRLSTLKQLAKKRELCHSRHIIDPGKPE
ncbi:MAG: hypothetical protein PWP04_40 [Candidatus Atribacteria bacterium]|nr:hypothetical protein [Candidatus Atribacteria bacterium]